MVLIGLVLSLLGLPYNGHSQTSLPFKVRLPAPPTDVPAFAAGQLVVKFKNNAAPAAIAALKQEHGVTKERPSKSANFTTLTLPEGARLMAAVADGERLVLRLETADGPQVLVVDLASGEIVVTVVLQP